MFPVLSESEDEKIRKEIIEVFKSLGEGKIPVPINFADIFTWLEKQGENNMGISEATKQKLEDNLNKALEKETPESWNEFLENQDEQKHTIDVTIPFEIPFGAKDSELQEAAYCIPEDFHAEIVGNKVIMKKIKKAKPAWSEEDDNKKDDTITAIDLIRTSSFKETNPNLYKAFGEAKNWLKSLKDRIILPQSELRKIEQKPTEWSIKDKIFIEDAIYFLQEYRRSDRCLNENDTQNAVTCEDWLNHLRPQNTWKPSDEQMEALDRAQAELCSTEYNKPICDLIESLNKLRKE